MLRFCLDADESITAIEHLKPKIGKIFFGSYQGHSISEEELKSRKKIEQIWKNIPDQIVEFSLDETKEFFLQNGAAS